MPRGPFWDNLVIQSLLISISVNTTAVSILFECTSYPVCHILHVFTPPPWVGCDTKSIFKQSIVDLNSKSLISYTGCFNNAKGPSLSYCGRKKNFKLLFSAGIVLAVGVSNLYISSNENDWCHSTRFTSPGNIKGCVLLPRSLLLLTC